MHICRAGRHCTVLSGLTPDGRCLECRRESHREAQARYQRTSKGERTNQRYESTAKAALRNIRYDAGERQ